MKSTFILVASIFFVLTSAVRAQDEHPPLDLHSIPISDWLNAGEHAEIPWNFTVRGPFLRVDQRLEVVYTARISAKVLNRSGEKHELFLVNRISSPDGEWLSEPNIVRHSLEGELPKNVQAEFLMRVIVQPGDYTLWSVLFDRKTGKHNLAKRRVRISEFRGDPLPDLYRRMPLIEFPEIDEQDSSGLGRVNGQLYLHVENKRPLQVELISMLSPPEQWTGRARVVRAHSDSTIGAVAALSQLDLAEGSLSITGLDLVRRQVLFEQHDLQNVEWIPFIEALKQAQSLNISAQALQGSKSNGAFFREVLSERLAADVPSDIMRVIIVVTSARLFESGSDLRPIQIEGDCNCRLYYLRFRLNMNDLFDQLEKFMKPLHPRVFNLMNAWDFRKAIAEIVEDLEKL